MRVSSTELTSRRRIAAAWSRADANGSIAGHLPDTYSRIGSAGQRLLETAGLSRGHADEQAAAGLGVTEQELVEHVEAVPIDLFPVSLVVPPRPAGKEVFFRQLAETGQE